MSITLRTLGLAVGLVGAFLAGCSREGDSASLSQRLKQLEDENRDLKKQVEKLSGDLRPLQAKVDELDVGHQGLEKTLAQARKDLEARVTELVQQEVTGRRPRFGPPQPPPPVRFEERPYMGFDGQDIEPDVAKLLNLKVKTGVLVTDVREGSPAAVAGLQKNDVVVALDGAEIKSFQDLRKALDGKKPNEVVTLSAVRGEEKADYKVTLGVRRVPVDQ